MAPIWLPFLRNEGLVSQVDALGQRYGKRPSEIIGITNEFTALDFDVAVMIKADKIARGEHTDERIQKEKQAEGFDKTRALQQKVAEMYRKQGNG